MQPVSHSAQARWPEAAASGDSTACASGTGKPSQAGAAAEQLHAAHEEGRIEDRRLPAQRVVAKGQREEHGTASTTAKESVQIAWLDEAQRPGQQSRARQQARDGAQQHRRLAALAARHAGRERQPEPAEGGVEGAQRNDEPEEPQHSVSRCRPSRLASATTTLMLALAAADHAAGQREAADDDERHQRQQHPGRPGACACPVRPAGRCGCARMRARSTIRPWPSGLSAMASRMACASSSGPASSTSCTASAIVASWKSKRCAAGFNGFLQHEQPAHRRARNYARATPAARP